MVQNKGPEAPIDVPDWLKVDSTKRPKPRPVKGLRQPCGRVTTRIGPSPEYRRKGPSLWGDSGPSPRGEP